MRKQRKESFLPRIDQTPSYKVLDEKPPTLELIQGNEKHVKSHLGLIIH